MAKEKDEFNLKNLPPEVQDESISKDDFKLVQADAKIHEQKFQTKPTTFFKDSLKRFAKNKSSLVATGILGLLLVMSIFVPLFSKTNASHDTSVSHPELAYLQPKLFNSGTGFWDGTKVVKDIPVDVSVEATTEEEKQEKWWPDPDTYDKGAVVEGSKKFTDEVYTSTATKYGKDGYVEFGYYSTIKDKYEYVHLDTKKIDSIDLNENHFITVFDTYDSEKLAASAEKTKEIPNNFVDGESALYFTFNHDGEDYSVEIIPYAISHSINEESKINVSSKILEGIHELGIYETTLNSGRFELRVKNRNDAKNNCVLVKSVKFVTESSNSSFKEAYEAPSFNSGTEAMIRKNEEIGAWVSYEPGFVTSYLSKVITCTFTYDTYEAKLGHKFITGFPLTKINQYKANGWLKFVVPANYDIATGKYVVDKDNYVCEILDDKKCPLAEPIDPDNIYLNTFGDVEALDCYVMKYKYDFGLETMPKFLLGTDKTGRDMFIYVFEGLRTSLILGLATTVICFLFGLFWGSVSGYFGGTVDLAMERFTDILSGIPWIVVMTLVIINMGSNFFTFALALCLTGWIGTAATTRTQFYRFRGREYVLASRTLGASSGRLIVKHILPNAMGTIITSAVLMVPSVIFSEATISYLGLGFKNLASLGVILSDNQVELTNNPYLLIFPSVVIALLMISFNLFGNGLRDAVNPSLKGEGE